MPNRRNESLIDGINLLLGAILLVSPWVLGFASDRMASWNACVSAAVIVGVAVTALLSFAEWEEWVEFVVGIWVLLSPWLIGYGDTGPAHTVHTVVGLGVIGLSLWELWLVHGQRPDVEA